jgi:hypothetical protein
VVRPGGTQAARQAIPDALAGSGGSLGCSGPGPLLLGCSGPPLPSALGALAGRGGLTYPSRSAETYSLSGTWEISDGAKRAPPRAGLSGEQHGAEMSRRLDPASFRVVGAKRAPPRAGPSGEQHGAEVSRRLGPAYFRVVVPCEGSSTVGFDRKQPTKGGSLYPVSISLVHRFRQFQEGGVRAGSS